MAQTEKDYKFMYEERKKDRINFKFRTPSFYTDVLNINGYCILFCFDVGT